MTAHTPGPWNCRPREFAGVRWDGVVRSAKNDPVCFVTLAGFSKKEGDANAKLIETAPDMIDALRQWAWAEKNNDPQELANARKSRDAAITKATGEEP